MIVHYAKVYENYELIGWRWQCDCGARSTVVKPTNMEAVKLGMAHINRKHR